MGEGPTEDGPRLSDKKPRKTDKHSEDTWGLSVADLTRAVANREQVKRTMWTGFVGEAIVGELLEGLGYEACKHPYVETADGGYYPDFEIVGSTPRLFVEVKAQSWNTSGTAGEKIAAVPFKYMPLCEHGRVLVVALAGAEREAEKMRLFMEPWAEKQNEDRHQLLQYVEAKGISFCRGSDLMAHYIHQFEALGGDLIEGMPKPLIKWVGGKQKLAPAIAAKLADALARAKEYYEPFVGAGGFLYHLLSAGALEGKTVIATDSNRRLIEFHIAVRDLPEELIRSLQGFRYEGGSQSYADLRMRFNEGAEESAVDRAAVFYVLMHSSFNGMYRENSKGQFNVPIGRPCGLAEFKLSERVVEDIRAASRLTKGVVFIAQDYLESLNNAATSGAAFVYADPPYEGTFNKYSCAEFDTSSLFRAIADSGVAAAVSNSVAGEVIAREFLPVFEVDRLETKYSVGAAAHTRCGKSEVLIRAPARAPPAPAPPAPALTADDFAALMAELGIGDD